MEKPADIPQDVWDAATKAWNDVYLNLISEEAATEVIARVILGERERWEVLLRDPNAVHLGMLRGTIAKLSWAQLGHIFGERVTH